MFRQKTQKFSPWFKVEIHVSDDVFTGRYVRIIFVFNRRSILDVFDENSSICSKHLSRYKFPHSDRIKAFVPQFVRPSCPGVEIESNVLWYVSRCTSRGLVGRRVLLQAVVFGADGSVTDDSINVNDKSQPINRRLLIPQGENFLSQGSNQSARITSMN